MRNKIEIVVLFSAILLALVAFGCGGAGVGGKGKDESVSVGADGERVISKQAREDFDGAVEKYKAAKKLGWNPDSCKKIAGEFEDVAGDNNNMAEALYNVGVVYRDCEMMDEAKAAFDKTLKHHKDHQLSITHLAVMKLESGDQSGAEELLRKAIGAGKNKLEAVPAYVNAAAILRRRGSKGDDDAFRKSQLNLRRALAIEAKYMPALFQLAMLYLDTAIVKKKTSYLTLATLVCNQALALDPEYGPIYHVLGQIHLQQSELIEALQMFEHAFKKDATLFASFMNFAAINLNFRGYEEAKMAFQKAIAIDPKNYDAHIGLGVALRGLGDFQGAKAEYKKAAEIDPKRVDYIFNTGLLEMDYLNTGTVDGYMKAKKIFKKFVSRATPDLKVDPDGKGPELSWYVKAEQRIKMCDKNKKQMEDAEREMKEMEKLAKEQKKREEDLMRQMEKAKKLEEQEKAGAEAPPEGAEGAVKPEDKKAEDKKADKKTDDKKADKKADKKE